MKRLALFLPALLIIAIHLRGTEAAAPATESQPRYPIIIIQGNTTHQVDSNEFHEIHLNKDLFSIQFYTGRYNSENREWHAAKFSVSDDIASFDRVTTGIPAEETITMGEARGIASHHTHYDYLFLDPDAYHYIFYQDEDIQRARLVSVENNMLLLQWDIYGVNIREERSFSPVSFTEADIPALFFAVHIDRNLDDHIDDGELYRFTIFFE